MKTVRFGLVAGLLFVLPLAGWAVIETYDFSSPDLEVRYHSLSQELRCPKCQNQNIADSNAPIARDLGLAPTWVFAALSGALAGGGGRRPGGAASSQHPVPQRRPRTSAAATNTPSTSARLLRHRPVTLRHVRR